MKNGNVRISDLILPVSNWNPSASAAEEFVYVDISSVDASQKRIAEPKSIPCSSAPSRARQLLKSADVLVSTVRPNLNCVAYVPGELEGAIASTGFCVLRPDKQALDSRYLLHWVQSKAFIGDMVSKATGASYPAVSDSIIYASEIPLPPLEDQRRIAAILDKVALLIQSAAQAFCLSQELKKSLVHETLGLAREGDERVRVKVRQVADMITGFPFKSAQYADNAQHTRLCRGINVLPDRIEWKQVARWPEITPELRSYQIDEDDILIAMDRPWIAEGFKIARVKPTDIPSLLVQRVARIRAGNQILPRILFEVLSSKAFATHCTPTETTVPHISPIEIREYEFELPYMKEQKKIDSILAGIEKSQAAMSHRANLLKEKLCMLSRSYFY
jgi:type I restriction enzyme, S subunit